MRSAANDQAQGSVRAPHAGAPERPCASTPCSRPAETRRAASAAGPAARRATTPDTRAC